MSSMWHGCFADTDYFEMRSAGGHDYGIWVTTPPNHDPTKKSIPALYVLDANWTVGLTAPLIITQLDPMQPITPYLQVSVGYAGEEAQHWASLRNRDLVPAGEPIAKEYVDAIEGALQAGSMTREQGDAHLAELRDCHADEFLTFLTTELHPRIERDYGTAADGHGLFGYSYGGLFSLFAWLSDTQLFETIGAGSPGVASPDSQIFTQLQKLGDEPRPAKLHVTINQQELLGDLAVYQSISRNTADLLHELSTRGDTVTSTILNETHVTGLQASFLSYLRTCRSSTS